MPTLEEVLAGVEKKGVQGPTAVPLHALTHDSRKAEPGAVFFALPGAKTDGNRHLKDALAKGAVAIVSELEAPPPPFSLKATWVQVKDIHEALGIAADRFYGRPSQAMKVVGITGTNGKTTTAYLLESIFAAAGHTVGVLGTVDYRIGGKVLERAVNTTPLASDLHRLLHIMQSGGASHIVMEVSSHALSLRRSDEVSFDVAVFTNLFRDHLDFHKDQGSYFEAKKRLFELLERGRTAKPERFAVLNGDDEWAPKLRGVAPHAHERIYGIARNTDLRAEEIELQPAGVRFVMRRAHTRHEVRLRMPGRHNVYNALAAACAAEALGIHDRKVVEGLEALNGVPGRLESVEEGQGFKVLVDYAHTDSAVETILANLKEVPHGRILTVLGCGGDRDRSKRGPMGLAACRGSDVVFLTSDNPRSEDPKAILQDIVAGVQAGGASNYRVVQDRGEAIREAIREARDGDIVLIAGKGHETHQILRDKTVHFDDREAAREALRALKTR